MHSALACEEIGVAGVTGSFDIWRLKISDGRRLSFVFHESSSSYYTGTLSTSGDTPGSTEASFDNPILHHVAKNVAKKGLQSILHVANKIGEHAPNLPNLPNLPNHLQHIFDPHSREVESNHDVLNTLNCILNSIAKNPGGGFMQDEEELLPLDQLLSISGKLDGDTILEGDPAARMHHAVELRVSVYIYIYLYT